MKKIIKLALILLIFLNISVTVYGKNPENRRIAGGVVPHHLLAKDIMVDFFEFIAEHEPNPDTIILLSPDHFNSAVLEKDTSFITVNWEDGEQNFSNTPVDIELLEKLSFKHNIKKMGSEKYLL